MTSLEFSMTLPAKIEKFIEFSKDYESFSEYLPQQIKKILILEKNSQGTITEETLVFSSVIKKEINQQSLHYEKSQNNLITEILSGPAKGSIIDLVFSIDKLGTRIDVKILLNISFKYKILKPMIVKWYKMILQGILLKMNTKIIQSETKLRS
tara:strand:- start:2179 stop:2637 length:459 start_codon:yes stop_codon:yes gene_type:complete